ncbi:MAG: hypothetical protein HY814_02385 [Candidatus Riflebacteria bacterium]|nr:hypothetical protein [Candidatus Riflebacteria bacterium]
MSSRNRKGRNPPKDRLEATDPGGSQDGPGVLGAHVPGLTRLRWLFSLSGFVMVCLAMVLVPVSLGIVEMLFKSVSDADASRTFLHAALGLCAVLLELAIIFKLYAGSIDLEISAATVPGQDVAWMKPSRTRLPKLCAMAFITIAMILVIWGMLAPAAAAGLPVATLRIGQEIHAVDHVRSALFEKSHQLAQLALLMAIVSLIYANEVRRQELRPAPDEP